MSSIAIRKISITDLDTDAIVNAANEGLWAGSGVCGAIFAAAGYEELQEACSKIGHCDTGSAVITPGFGLKAKYIIHAVGPIWKDGKHQEPELLYGAYYKSLELAAAHGCRSIGFPLISAGVFGYPVDLAWYRAFDACKDFLDQHRKEPMDIVFAVLDNDILETGHKKLLQSGAARYKVAARNDWKILDMPEQHDTFTLDRTFTPRQMAALRHGNIPQEMEDKWFWFMEGDTLYAHRSWTGFCIYRVDFKPDGHHAVTVNRNPEQYTCTSIEKDLEQLHNLLNWWTQTPYDHYHEWLDEVAQSLTKPVEAPKPAEEAKKAAESAKQTVQAAEKSVQAANSAKQSVQPAKAEPQKKLSYQEAKQARIKIFNNTYGRCQSDPELATAIVYSKQKTEVFYENEYPIGEPPAQYRTEIVVSQKRSFEAAMDLKKERPAAKVAVLNFANAFHPGGGVTTGSSAQEESLCRCSTLYPLLYRKSLKAKYYDYHAKLNDPKATDAVIYTEDVVIFKTDTDYPEMMERSEWVRVDVMTCAAPDLRQKANTHAALYGAGTTMNHAELFGYHVRRAIHLLAVAAAKGADTLVLGAFGCGAFENDPEVVARAYKTALQEFDGVFRKIEFAIYTTGDGKNYHAFAKAFGK